MREAAASDDRMIGHVFSISSESHRIAYLSLLKGHLATLLSFVMQFHADSPATVETALDQGLRRKAIVAEAFALQRDVVPGDSYPELVAELARLVTLRGEIARKTLDGPDLENVDEFKQFLAKRHRQKEQLEAELA